ncbi:MAG: hypothetical protein LC687_01985 [Actinobacteria bacterium]|nr:hypothetical protein [Actinomycetota bacterium]MCA1806622.1 hypothetical protein [Actinomycetota bacterium]
MPLFEVVEGDNYEELLVRTDDDTMIHTDVVNLVMEVMRLNPGFAKHWLQAAEYMVFERGALEEWGEA